MQHSKDTGWLQWRAPRDELADIEAHITRGVSVPLPTSPSSAFYANTPTVAEHADAVRSRLRQYEQFGIQSAIHLPAETSIAEGDPRVEPLHVIVRPARSPACAWLVGDGGHEASEACDAVLLEVQNADAAELQLCEGRRRVDVHGRADGAESALPRLVREARVAAERVAGEDVDELT